MSSTDDHGESMRGATQSLVQRWFDVVRALPDRPAIASSGAQFTFAEADSASDLVASQLHSLSEGAEPVSLLVDHTAQAVVGLLGVVKTGHPVVLMDPHLPAERLRRISALVGAPTCIADAPHLAAANALGGPLVDVLALEALMVEDDPATASRPARSEAAQREGRDAAAIAFTSGSTGQPKGVVLTHGGLINDVDVVGKRLAISTDDRFAQVLPYGFAAGLQFLLIALLNGASAWSYDPRDHGTKGLAAWISRQRLSTLVCTPHLLRSLAEVLPRDEILGSLRTVMTTGEAAFGHDVEAIRRHLPPDATYFNQLGSSETGAIAIHEIGAASTLVPTGVVPAGRIVPNKTVHLIREDGTVAGNGEVGRVCVVSDALLSSGYWKDTGDTAAKFAVQVDGRWGYELGDLGTFDENGELVLLGRSDAAVKIRGYLVEPSEVEAALLSLHGVLDTVVVATSEPDVGSRLVAYVVPDPNVRTESPAALRRGLHARLPEYMVPSVIVPLVSLPRNERGKVSRPDLPPVSSRPEPVEPVAAREVVIGDLWGEILGLHDVGRDDEFLALGGDSLAVEEMLAGVRQHFGVSLSSSDLIDAPTLAEFTRRVGMGSASLPSHPDVITLRANETGTPVFCFAGAGALALAFVPLSRRLQDRPVYAFQAHGLERRGRPDWSIQAAARRYLEIIRVLRPFGPYVLVGHSSGGLVALEIAQMLSRANEPVDLVALLDTHLPPGSADEPVAGDRAAARIPLVRRGRHLLDVAQRVRPEGLPSLDSWGRHARALLAGVITQPGQRQFDAFFDQGLFCCRRYEVAPYGGNALVVIAENNPDGEAAWRRFLIGPHRFHHQASEHSSMLREPHVNDLAQVIGEELALVRELDLMGSNRSNGVASLAASEPR